MRSITTARLAMIVVMIITVFATFARGGETRVHIGYLQQFTAAHAAELDRLTPAERQQFDTELATVIDSADSQGYACVRLPNFLAATVNGMGWLIRQPYYAAEWVVVGTAHNAAWAWNGTFGQITLPRWGRTAAVEPRAPIVIESPETAPTAAQLDTIRRIADEVNAKVEANTARELKAAADQAASQAAAAEASRLRYEELKQKYAMEKLPAFATYPPAKGR